MHDSTLRPSINFVALFELQWVQAEREISATKPAGVRSKATCIILGTEGTPLRILASTQIILQCSYFEPVPPGKRKDST